jgi:hypothetical protein
LTLLAWTVFVVLLIGTPIYLWRTGGVHKPAQLVISTGAYLVWAFAYPGPPFDAFGIPPVYGSVIMGLYTFIISLFTI